MNIQESPELQQQRRINTFTDLVKEAYIDGIVTDYSSFYGIEGRYESFIVKIKSNYWWKRNRFICDVDFWWIYSPKGGTCYTTLKNGTKENMLRLGQVFEKVRWIVTIIDNGT